MAGAGRGRRRKTLARTVARQASRAVDSLLSKSSGPTPDDDNKDTDHPTQVLHESPSTKPSVHRLAEEQALLLVVVEARSRAPNQPVAREGARALVREDPAQRAHRRKAHVDVGGD